MEATNGSRLAADDAGSGVIWAICSKSATNGSRRQQVGATYKQEVAGSIPAPPIPRKANAHAVPGRIGRHQLVLGWVVGTTFGYQPPIQMSLDRSVVVQAVAASSPVVTLHNCKQMSIFFPSWLSNQ